MKQEVLYDYVLQVIVGAFESFETFEMCLDLVGGEVCMLKDCKTNQSGGVPAAAFWMNRSVEKI